MTSQLNVDTIVDKAGSGGTNVKIGNTSTYVSDGGAVTQNTVQSLAKAFYRGTSDITIEKAFNIGSGTDNGTGDYTYNLTNNMSDDDYVAIAGGHTGGNKLAVVSSFTTSSIRIDFFNAGTAGNIDGTTMASVYGDLA